MLIRDKYAIQRNNILLLVVTAQQCNNRVLMLVTLRVPPCPGMAGQGIPLQEYLLATQLAFVVGGQGVGVPGGEGGTVQPQLSLQ